MLIRQRAGDIERSEQGEDVGLKDLDHELEECEGDPDQEGEWAHDLESKDTHQEVLSAKEEDQEEQVTCEHIREETK